MNEERPVVRFSNSGQNDQPPPPPRPIVQPRARKGRAGCLVAGIVIGVVVVLGGLLVLAVAMVSMVSRGASAVVADRESQQRFREITLRAGGPVKIMVIPVEGVIASKGVIAEARDPVEMYQVQLQKAAKDPKVAAVIVMINSPGGGITATDLMHKATIDFKKQTRKPVVACLTDIAASGGYYLAAAADKIIAHETTLTGSIGVIIPLYDFTDLMSKLGVKQNFVTSGTLKSMGSPFTKLSDEQKKLFQDMVDEMYGRFVSIVAEGRKLEREQVIQVADGRIMTGRTALEHKLVDRLGYFGDAIETAEELAGAKGTKVVTYKPIISIFELLYTQTSQGRSRSIRIEDIFAGSFGKPLYLWMVPGTANAGRK